MEWEWVGEFMCDTDRMVILDTPSDDRHEHEEQNALW